MAMKKPKIQEPKPRVGPNNVRAWFDTVINPVLEALALERDLLRKKNWTWQFQPGGLESIRHITAHIAPEARPNLELFMQLNPAIAQNLKAHDNSVDELSRACSELQSALENSSRLRELYMKFTSPKSIASMQRTAADLFGAYPESHHLALLAQYIMNNTPDLPDYYYAAPFWNRYKKILLALLSTSAIRSRNQAVITAGALLLRCVNQLIISLKTVRLRLSLEYDVPPGGRWARPDEVF